MMNKFAIARTLSAGFVLAAIFSASAGIRPIGDADWTVLDSAQLNGVNSSVYAMAYRNGLLYAGGSFFATGNKPSGGLATWDGVAWRPLEPQLRVQVTAMVFDKSGNMYIGGYLDSIGSIAYVNVAQWNGVTWRVLSAGMYQHVNALCLDSQGVLYAGGTFDSISGVKFNNIAKWDGTHWSSLGSGIAYSQKSGTSFEIVRALACDGKGNLYAAGLFDTAGGNVVRNIARWNGATWDSLPGGPNRFFRALALDGSGNLFAGAISSYDSSNFVVKWDGRQWSKIGATGPVFSVTSIEALLCDNKGNLFAGGEFSNIDNVVVGNVAQWNGSRWTALGSGTRDVFPSHVSSFALDDAGNLFVGGEIDSVGGFAVCHIARWDGAKWNSLGIKTDGINGTVRCIALEPGGKYYVGGAFDRIGKTGARNIAKWDGTEWNAFGFGMNGQVNDFFRSDNGILYAAGNFTRAGDAGANHVAKWDGANWSPLGSGINGVVYALVSDARGNVYAGGTFDSAGGQPAGCVAKWDGSAWSRLKAAMYNKTDTVFTLACNKAGDLFAAGRFTVAGDSTVNNIARWNGSSWSSLGSGVRPGHWVNCLTVDNFDNLYAGGEFDTIGGVAAANIARWDGEKWTACGVAPRGIHALRCDKNGNVYAGGENSFFQTGLTIGGDLIAKWDGARWNRLGSGINGGGRAIWTLQVVDSTLYVGGAFDFAGNMLSPRLASVNIHDMPMNEVISRSIAASIPRVSWRYRNSALLLKNTEPKDYVFLYTLSGRCVVRVQGISTINLSGTAHQLLLIRIQRAAKTIATGLVTEP